MRTVRRLLHAELLGAIAFVTLAFLALFFFIDLVDDLDNLGRGGYGLHHALGYCLLLVPGLACAATAGLLVRSDVRAWFAARPHQP